MTVIDKSWFVEAVVAALVGLFLLVAGVVLVSSRRTGPPVGRRAAGAGAGAAGAPGTIDPVETVDAEDGIEPTVPFTVAVPVGPIEAADAHVAPGTRDP